MIVPNIEPTQWTKSDDWRTMVSPAHHADFLEAIADAQRDGDVIGSVTVIGGVPIAYNIA